MKRLLVIGIGAGDPAHVTFQAVEALNRVDVFFVVDKGSATGELTELRHEILARYVTQPAYRVVEVPDVERRSARDGGYGESVAAWHGRRTGLYERLLAEELPDGGVGGILAWGDPTLYDSTLRIVDEIMARGRVELECEVIPGISSVAVLTARHRIPLNRIGGPVTITTGRRLAAGWPPGADTVVGMLDGQGAFLDLDPAGVTIWWGAYLGTADELLVAGPLADTRDEIARLRTEARARKGWLFDTYLLRRDDDHRG